jgi:simple sugar transport system permease protein
MRHALNVWQAVVQRPAIWMSAAVLGAGAVGLVLVAAMGVSVSDALAAFADGAWGSPYAVASSLNRSLVLALVGLGFIAAQRAQLTNVGARARSPSGHRGDRGGAVRPCGRAALGPELLLPCWRPRWPGHCGAGWRAI